MDHRIVVGAIALALATSAFFTGCSKSTAGMANVVGTVTFNGTPVEEGTITFIATNDGRSSGAPIKDGKYSTKCFPGPKRLEITGHRLVPGKMDALGMPQVEQYLPVEYNRKSRLLREVQLDAENIFDIDLKSDGRQ